MFRNNFDPMLPTRCVRTRGCTHFGVHRLDVDDLFGAEGLPAQRRRTDGNPEVRVLVYVIQRAAERLDRHVEHPHVLVVELDEVMWLADRRDLKVRRRCTLSQHDTRKRGDAQRHPTNCPHVSG